ncbi:unnamed protein product [Owenia fusiformis]|uniref:Uncharacterized protein n=1 Tax=Owenia fusiformis TaxID=6347 RepID=A0A8J1XPE5_OWEFU|nr:unnamed protein product [Owenia fusiformis]
MLPVPRYIDNPTIVRNKENPKQAQQSMASCQTPVRAPLKDVNNSAVVAMVKKGAQVGTPSKKTPRRKSDKMKGALKKPPVAIYEDITPVKDKPSNEGAALMTSKPCEESVALNTLVYNRVVDIVSKTQQAYEAELAVRDNKIGELTEQLEQRSPVATKPQADSVNESHFLDLFVDILVSSTIDNALQSLSHPHGNNTSCHSNTTCCHANNTTNTDNQLNPDIQSPIIVTHKKGILLNNQQKNDNSNNQTTKHHSNNSKTVNFNDDIVIIPASDDIIDEESGDSNEHKCENDTKTETKDLPDDTKSANKRLSEISTIKIDSEACYKSLDSRFDKIMSTLSESVSTTLTEAQSKQQEGSTTCMSQSHQETMTDIVQVMVVATNTSPMLRAQRVFCDSETSTVTPIKCINVETCTSPIRSLSIETCMTPKKTLDFEQNTSVVMTTQSISTSPIKTSATETMVTPVKCQENSQMTSPVGMATTETMVTPTKHIDSAQGMSPLPPKVDSSQGMSPLPSRIDSSQGMSPLPERVDRSSITSPVGNSVLRYSKDDLSDLNTHDLAHQLETATISNALLRHELSELKQTQEHVTKQLDEARQNDFDNKMEIEKIKEEQHLQLEDIEARKDSELKELKGLVCDQQRTIEDLKNSLTSEAESHQKQLESIKEENHNLQEDLCRTFKQHKQEMHNLEKRHQENDYKPHFERSQVIIEELRAELDVYVDMMSSLDTANTVQEELMSVLSQGHSEVTQLAESTLKQKADLEEQHKVMVEKIEQNDNAMSKMTDENNAMREKYEAMKSEWELMKAEKIQMEILYEGTHADLGSSMTRISELTDSLSLCQERLQEKTDLLKVLHDDMAILQDQDCDNFMHIQTLHAAIGVQDMELDAQCEKTAEAEKQVKVLQEHLNAECERFDIDTQNLQRTLDSREEDINTLQAESDKQRATIAEMTPYIRQLELQVEESKYTYRELCMTKDLLQSTQSSSKETQEFLEEERNMLSESLAEKEESLKQATMMLAAKQREFQQKSQLCADLTEQVQTQSDTIHQLKDELDSTKAHAHYMLLNQGSEIRDVAFETDRVTQRMEQVIEALSEKTSQFQSDKAEEDEPEEPIPEPPLMTSTFKSQSLISSILSAIQTSPESPDSSQEPIKISNVSKMADTSKMADSSNTSNLTTTNSIYVTPDQSPDVEITDNTIQQPVQIGCGNSAFTKVTKLSNKDSIEERQPHTIKDSASVEGDMTSFDEVDAMPVDVCEASQYAEESPSKSPGEVENGVVDRVASLGDMLSSIISLMTKIEKVTNANKESLMQDIESLKCKLEASKTFYKEETTNLHQQILSLQEREVKFRQELVERKNEIANKSKDLEYTKSKLESMADNVGHLVDQQSTIEKLSKELKSLQVLNSSLVAEKTQSVEHLEEALKRLDDVSKGSMCYVSEGQYLREKHNLKKEINILRGKLSEKGEYCDELSAKANKRMQLLDENWKKAEAEVYRLDELVEHIRQVLHAERNNLEGLKALEKLQRDLDGIEAAQTPLRSINSKNYPKLDLETVKTGNLFI